jgi:hypothetical protein
MDNIAILTQRDSENLVQKNIFIAIVKSRSYLGVNKVVPTSLR